MNAFWLVFTFMVILFTTSAIIASIVFKKDAEKSVILPPMGELLEDDDTDTEEEAFSNLKLTNQKEWE